MALAEIAEKTGGGLIVRGYGFEWPLEPVTFPQDHLRERLVETGISPKRADRLVRNLLNFGNGGEPLIEVYKKGIRIHFLFNDDESERGVKGRSLYLGFPEPREQGSFLAIAEDNVIAGTTILVDPFTITVRGNQWGVNSFVFSNWEARVTLDQRGNLTSEEI